MVPREIGVPAHRLAERFGRVSETPLIEERDAQLEVETGEVGTIGERVANDRFGVGGATLSPQDQSEVESRLDVVGAKIQRLTQGGFSVGKPAASQRRARPSTPGGEVAHVMRRLRSREYT